MNPVRRTVIVAFAQVQSLDVTGPAEVFSLADRASEQPLYQLELVAPGGGRVRTSSGLELVPSGSLADCRGPIDTLIVAGGLGTRDAAIDEALISWLRLAARRSRRVTSVCTGAFLLARAGVLDGRRATTHWAACAALARNYPAIDVQPAPIFVRDGNVYTSAGVTAGIDLALALVEEDLGSRAALAVARDLVLFSRRPGGQAQFSSSLAGQDADRPSVRELQSWIADHLDADLSVGALAERSFMSQRNFARVFGREVGVRILDGLEATSHWLALEYLREFGATPVERRVVKQGKVITAAGVSSGIDMALTLAAHIAGEALAQAIQLGIEYDPQPPFDSGSTAKAAPEIVELVRSRASQLA